MLIELADIVERVVEETLFFDLAVTGVTQLDELLSGMQIYATIGGHDGSPFMHSSPKARLCRVAEESHLFHHISYPAKKRYVKASRKVTAHQYVGTALCIEANIYGNAYCFLCLYQRQWLHASVEMWCK